MKIRRIDFGQGSRDQEQAINGNELRIDRSIYKNMSSLTENKMLQTPTTIDTPFKRWLMDMETLADTGVGTTALKQLDEYLGDLGITKTYPFEEDTYFVEPWINVDDQYETRNVADIHDNYSDNIVIDGDNVIWYT